MFIEKPASKSSISKRKPVHGAGVNDADYVTSQDISGKILRCPYYMTWKSMLERCYSEACQEKHPTYYGCSVSDEWLSFAAFRSWMELQDWNGMALDKDIIKPGNKLYSRDYCVFVSQDINNLLNSSDAARGCLPQGVTLNNLSKKYRSRLSVKSKRIHLGYFDTPEEAFAAYVKAKTNHIIEIAKEQTDPRIKDGLMLHAELIRNS